MKVQSRDAESIDRHLEKPDEGADGPAGNRVVPAGRPQPIETRTAPPC